MKIEKTELEGVLIIEPDVFGDERGWFMESYNKNKLKEQSGIETEFVQDNHSMSVKAGVLRGLHFQKEPYAQSKLVRCTKGKVLDVAVDLRKDSPTFKKWISIELTGENKKQVFIPRGFAHGFLTLVDDTEIQYKTDNMYSKECDRGIRYNDPEIGVNWGEIEPILSQKDTEAPFLKDSDTEF